MIYEVIVDISNSEVDRVFDYLSDTSIAVGSRVKVPFSGRFQEGFVIGVKENSEVDQSKLKKIIGILDEFTAVSAEMISLMHFLADKFHIRYIDSLRLFLPAQMRGGRVKELTRKTVSLSTEFSTEQILAQLKDNAAKQKELIRFLADGKQALLANLPPYGAAAVKALEKKGFVTVTDTVVKRTPYKELTGKPTTVKLTGEQSQAVASILNNPQDTHLLFGVTGSGKTEVYMSVIDEMLKQGKTAVMLVPEISLTPQFLGLFRTRYGGSVAIIHSGLSSGERHDEWMRLKKGEAKIALGARSAVFAPLENLGVLILDEEHDSSYQSDSNPRYNTFDVALFRSNYNKAALVLGSATPAVTTYYKAMSGGFRLLEMKNRINETPLPEVKIVDMTLEMRSGNKGFLSTTLTEELTKTLQSGNQAMLFLNRRGFSSFVLCSRCGYVPKCTDCDVSLSFHSEDSELKCHYCGKRFHMFDICPQCQNPYIRQGKTGTERVVKELEKLFPSASILRMDFDTTQTKESHFKIIDSFAKKEAQILVGTQMIAKGHDFQGVMLVGIIDADQSLHFSDYRAYERTFQLLTQVSGRSGRGGKRGLVVLQTYSPKHFVLQLAAKQDYQSFYNREINIREASKFPPFATILRVLYQSENEQDCVLQLNEHFAQLQKLQKENSDEILFCQKMKSPVKKIEKKFRYQILMKLCEDSDAAVNQIFVVCGTKNKKGVSVFVEINPQNLN